MVESGWCGTALAARAMWIVFFYFFDFDSRVMFICFFFFGLRSKLFSIAWCALVFVFGLVSRAHSLRVHLFSLSLLIMFVKVVRFV